MKIGDIVKNKNSESGELGLFMGMRAFESRLVGGDTYTCAEVMWFNQRAPNGDVVSSIQQNLIEVIK